MDENIINLIRNRISNDYYKLMCDEVIEEKSKLIMESYIIGLMIYCMIYDIPYFVEYIYKENTKNNFLKEQEQINILYLYYLEKNNKEDIDLKNNKKIDRILNWNIFLIKKYNTIEDKI